MVSTQIEVYYKFIMWKIVGRKGKALPLQLCISFGILVEIEL
jgi:hypothetical protein